MNNAPADYVVPPDVGWTVDEDPDGAPRVHASRLPDGPVMVLAGASGLIWQVAAGGSDSVIDEVAAATGQTADIVRDDVTDFLAELVKVGLLQRVARPADETPRGWHDEAQ